MRPDPAIRFWDGDTLALSPEVTLVRLGGHFPGATVLHWWPDSRQRGVLLTGDTVQVVADPHRVTFLWSYPNMVPLPASTVRRMADRLRQWPTDRVYGFAPGRQILDNGSEAIEHSARRYIDLLAADL